MFTLLFTLTYQSYNRIALMEALKLFQEILCTRVRMITSKLIVSMLSISAVLGYYTNIDVEELLSRLYVGPSALRALPYKSY